MAMKEFGWSPEDWERAKSWAATVKAPVTGCLSLWDWAKSEDSVWTLHLLNAYVKRLKRLDSSPQKP
jgi:hypothetical protein